MIGVRGVHRGQAGHDVAGLASLGEADVVGSEDRSHGYGRFWGARSAGQNQANGDDGVHDELSHGLRVHHAGQC